ncbi:GPI mannosyltransferase 2-like isoform X2 [Daphnia pulicaria]|uniref:GPI mannosyltransferase 2-like isoform X2 n=1 Tax=Daphnia pulicaria TaxID=35523 RepID=UPI001EEAE407|nr:GPI mannosyltransferase 2-like isoform X2 [Daphnia pulicaria]
MYSTIFHLLNLCCTFVCYWFIFNHLIPDHQSDGFQSPYKLFPTNSTLLDTIVDYTLGGFARWDGQYFLHISTLGYTHENCLAFFPAYPLLLRFTSVCLSFLSCHTLTYWNSTLLGSIIINTVCFIIAAYFLFLITDKLFNNSNFALQTWKLFCISPATIFFLAPYSESLFSALTFGGIYNCIEYKFLTASIFFAGSGLTRSNGLVNIGFLLYFAVKKTFSTKWKGVPTLVAKIVISVIITVFPFLCYQYYAFTLFCFHKPHRLPTVIHNYLVDRNFTVRGERIPQWCEQSIPFSYSVIQSQYWNVGFLRYFEWKQLPNFLLAAPILCLVFLYSLMYVKQNFHIVSHYNSFTSGRSQISHPIFRPAACVFAAHSIFLGLFTFFFAHVQISTRLIGSSCPAVYWMMTWMMDGKLASKRNLMEQWNPLRQKNLSTAGKCVRFYCLSYVVIGTVMFVNHLPWT